jgi:hypothetical protein
MSVPSNWLLVKNDVHLFGFQVLFNPPGTQFTTKAGLFVTAPRSLATFSSSAVDSSSRVQRIAPLRRFHPY